MIVETNGGAALYLDAKFQPLSPDQSVSDAYWVRAAAANGMMYTIAGDAQDLARKDFRPDEPRDDQGRWTSGGAASSAAPSSSTIAGVTSTPEFRRWFKNSKVVDANGNPLVVYHGTANDISVFDPTASGASGQAAAEGGIFFTPSPELGSIFAGLATSEPMSYGPRGGVHGHANVIPAFLSIRNPLVVGIDDVMSERGEMLVNNPGKMRAVISKAKAAGHDGVHITDYVEYGTDIHGNEYTIRAPQWVAFKSTQIKSAIGNSGAFDPKDPDITKDFDPNEPRDDHGQWTDGGGGAAGPKIGTGQQTQGILRPVPERQVAAAEAKLAAEGITPEVMTAQIDHYAQYAREHPEVWAEGMEWYEKEHDLAVGIAATSTRGMTADRAAAVLAADSPRTSVDTARANAAATVAAVNADGKLEVTAQMVEARYQNSLAMAKEGPAERYAGLAAAAESQRAYALQNEIGSHDLLTGNADVISRWHPARTILADNWTKGLQIARGEGPEGVLSGPKVWSFYDNMRDPHNSKSVTIDAWMVRAVSGKLNATQNEMSKILGGTPKGSRTSGRYEVFARRVTEAARRNNIKPLQMQAIVWTAIQAERKAGG